MKNPQLLGVSKSKVAKKKEEVRETEGTKPKDFLLSFMEPHGGHSAHS